MSNLHTAIAVLALSFAGQTLAQDLGRGAGPVTGSAGPQGSQGASMQLEKCTKILGTLAVNEPQDAVSAALRGYGLTSPTGLIRLIIQQSGCFTVVERGRAMQNIVQERALADSGQLQAGSNIGRGQLVVADFVLTPDVVFSNNNAGGMGAAIGSLFGPIGAVIGGGLRFKQAQTSMLVSDARSGIQVAAASGSSQKTDFALGGILGGLGGGLGLGAYENTAEGKVVSASFLDNWNQIVRAVRDNPSLVQTQSAASQGNAAASLQANAAAAGDIMVPRIAGVRVLKIPADNGAVLVQLTRNDEVIFDGKEENGYLRVTTSTGDGWVKKTLMKKP
jgi:curli biogenesis system outer membrane secretion channel CsgG